MPAIDRLILVPIRPYTSCRIDRLLATGGRALQMMGRTIRNLYYITHLDNVPSILRHGILSHEEIQSRGLAFTAIYDTAIVSRRSQISVPDGRTLWSFANLYFQPRNPMLYRVAIEQGADHLAVVAVKTNVLARPDVMLANGNAAHRSTVIVPAPNGISSSRGSPISTISPGGTQRTAPSDESWLSAWYLA
jgi:ssDNA thymidine ADP-ribosyltransferase, DarT